MYLAEMAAVAVASAVNACVSFTVADSALFNGVRERARARIPPLGKMLSCGYCFGHWTALALVALVPLHVGVCGRWWPDFAMTVLLVAWLSGLQWAAMCALLEHADK